MFFNQSAWLLHNPPGSYSGVAVADVDGDGRFEVVVAGLAGPNRVLKWAGGRLRDIAPPPLADADRQAVAVAAGDLDGDGSEELYVLNADPNPDGPGRFADGLFRRDPGGWWDDLFAVPRNQPVRTLAAGRGVAVIDRRGVGRYGFVVANSDRPARLYEQGPGGFLADLAPPLTLARPGAWGVLAAPLLGDHTDLFCPNERGGNLLFHNRGDGTFEECAAPFNLADAGEHGHAAAVVDAGGDGQPALCVANRDGPHRLLVRQADGTWKDRATPGLAFPSRVQSVVAADFDNDGHDEVFFNTLGEPNRLFRLSPETATMLDPLAAAEPDGFGTGAAVADLDGDGVLELVVAHGGEESQPLSVYKARPAAGAGWLRVLPQTRFGAPARGAVVRAEYGGRVRVKVIDGGSGLCQSEPVAHFGLGRETRVAWVSVTWPDGAALTMHNPDLNCTYTVPYSGG